MDGVGSKRKHMTSNSTQMTYNVVEYLSKLRITLPFTEVVKIPQQRENILKLLDDPYEREEVVVTSPKQTPGQSTANMRGKIPPFYISIENHDVALHNCLVDTGAMNNIMPLAVMEALGMSCTKYYETMVKVYMQLILEKCQLMEKSRTFMLGLQQPPISLQFSILLW
jgi:hypothetical protein